MPETINVDFDTKEPRLPAIEYLSEDDWKAIHNLPGVISASEVPAILGINPWQSPYTVWARKTGQLPAVYETRAMRAGKHMEPFIAAEYERETGREVTDPGDFTIYRSRDYEWLICTPDRFDDRKGVAELKNPRSAHSGPEWRQEQGPDMYKVQLQIQMYCTELDYGSLVAFLGGDDLAVHDFRPHERLMKAILPRLAEFRERVLNNDPPPVDASQSTADTLKALHPQDNGKTVVLMPEHAVLFQAREHLKETERDAREALRGVENEIKALIGDNTFAVCDGQKYKYGTVTRKGEITVDLNDENLQLLDAHGVEHKTTSPSTYRTLRRVKS